MSMTASILVCDDDEDTRALIGQALQLRGYSVELVEDGHAAKSICSQREFDLIVMDILMPRMSGIEFVRWLRADDTHPWTPVLLVTALDDVSYRVQGLDAGADDYLVKPFQLRELEARVAALLRTKQLMIELSHRNAELIRLNEERERLQATLLERERALVASQLAGAAAHELLQPVTTVALSCHQLHSLLAQLGANEAKEGKAILETMTLQCQEMREIIDRLPSVDATKTIDYVEGDRILSLKDKA